MHKLVFSDLLVYIIATRGTV